MVTKNNPNVIANPSTKPPQGPEMNDRDRMNDLLSTEKYLLQNITIAAWEASHHQLQQDIDSILQETQQCQRRAYELMFRKGWYKLQAADQQELDQTYQQFSNYMTQLPYSNQIQ